ncbi:hypothetical protein IWW48_006332 [Coemansia sp. RSA 1200]|nr:hypothetical protein IWW48_006332 [Coemansia sp. RSA 1200]
MLFIPYLIIAVLGFAIGTDALEFNHRQRVKIVAGGTVGAVAAFGHYADWWQGNYPSQPYRLVFRTIKTDEPKQKGPVTDLVVVHQPFANDNDNGDCANGQTAFLVLSANSHMRASGSNSVPSNSDNKTANNSDNKTANNSDDNSDSNNNAACNSDNNSNIEIANSGNSRACGTGYNCSDNDKSNIGYMGALYNDNNRSNKGRRVTYASRRDASWNSGSSSSASCNPRGNVSSGENTRFSASNARRSGNNIRGNAGNNRCSNPRGNVTSNIRADVSSNTICSDHNTRYRTYTFSSNSRSNARGSACFSSRDAKGTVL